jgi:UDP-N-acetylmuramate--alanine ligase
MFAKAQRVHFIGIGGIGMSGIAEILISLGYPVSGSDLKRSPITDRLAGLGATIFVGHAAANVLGAAVVVVSSAVNDLNPEVVEARASNVPVILRAEMLAELMRLKYGIAVAGMHGKTTTTSMIAAILAVGGLDPTIVVGGRIDAMGSNARHGKSQYLVAEADESDRSFLKLSPILCVVTNLDREHMDCYRDMADVEAAFASFMDRVPFYGAVTACIDDPLLAAVLPRVRRRVYTYGFTTDADFVCRLLPAGEGARSRFEVLAAGQLLGAFALHVPGRHNVLNATAAIAIGAQLEIAPQEMATALAEFRGVDRRFQLKGMARGVTVVDDYGHHPTEIRATLAAARDCGYRHIHVIFQPHRYSRTRDLMDEFATAFNEADSVELLDIYAASEEPIPGIDAETLTARITAAIGESRQVHYAGDAAHAIAAITRRAEDGDLIMTLGAGSVSQIGPQVLEALGKLS